MLSEWLGVEIMELNVRTDHVHAVVLIPPKVSVSQNIGVINGKMVIKLFKGYPMLKKKPYWCYHFWALCYFVNTVGVDEDLVRRYVKLHKEQERKEENDWDEFR